MKYNTFICYRGDAVDNGIGKRIAKQVYDIIKQDDRYAPVFFAPFESNYNFIADVPDIMKSVRTMITIISPNFFNGFDENPDESATHHELSAAFEHANCVFFPIFAYGFSWNDATKQWLDDRYGVANAHRLYHMKGMVVSGDNVDAQQLKSELGDDQRPRGIQKRLRDKQEFERQEKACGETIFDLAFLLNADEYMSDFYECQIEQKLYIPNRFLETFREVASKCQLTESEFVYWPVDFDGNHRHNKQMISICAICFGVIILRNYLKIAPKEEQLDIKVLIDGAINLLIMMRSPKAFTWPSTWTFVDANMVEGTINQTTFSISTLLTCGFLKMSSEEKPLDLHLFKERYSFLCDSIDALIAAKFSRQRIKTTGWGYMMKDSSPALSPTSFVFDTLLKFKKSIECYIPEAELSDPPFATLLTAKAKEIEDLLLATINYFQSQQNQNGSFGAKNTFSITHTAKIVKSLCAYLLESECPYNSEARNIVKRGLEYLMQIPRERLWNLEEYERFELFQYNSVDTPYDASASGMLNRNSGEKFEHAGELLYIDALIKCAEIYPDKADDLLDRAQSLLNEYQKRYVSKQQESIVVRGSREDLKYPIWYIYYYRMTLRDFLKHCEI